MKVNITNLKNSQKEISISLDTNQMAKYRKQAITNLTKIAKIKGLKESEITEEILVKELGETPIMQETVNLAMTESYKTALIENKITPLTQAQVAINHHNPLSVVFTVDVLPEVTLGDYKNIKVTVKEEEITKKEVEEVMKQLQEQVPSLKEVKRAAKLGDIATFDFAGFDMKGKPVPNTEGKDHALELGSNQFIPGFEEKMVGMEIGKESSLEITFPKDYHAKEMAGVTYKFVITIKKLEEKSSPELNEEFVEKITGKKDSITSLEKEIEKNLKMKKYQESRAQAEEEILGKLAQQAELEVPTTLINEEASFLIDNIKMQGLQQGMPWEHYLKQMKRTEDQLKKDLEKDAAERVKNRLIIQEIIKLEKLKADEKEVARRAELRLQQIPEAKRDEKQIESHKAGGRMYEQLANMMLVEQVFKIFLGELPAFFKN